jgi:hypothetical protein
MEDTNHYVGSAHRASLAQIIDKSKENSESTPMNNNPNIIHQSRKVNPVNFRINIDKLKNLKPEGRDPLRLNTNHSALKSQSLQAENRRSLFLRRPNRDRKLNASCE